MNKVTPLIKFTECFGISRDFILKENITESDFEAKGINVNDFKTKMIKSDMSEYAFFLLYYFTETLSQSNEDDLEMIFEPIKLVDEINKQYELDLTRALLFLYTDKSTAKTAITISKSRSNITIKNEQIVKNIANQLFIEFKKQNYHKAPLTYQEAKDKMLSIEKFAPYVFRNVNIGTEENPILEEQEHADNIEYFAEKNPKEIEINKESLEAKLATLNNKGKKRGAKVKNARIADLCEKLSFLKRIDRYLEQSEEELICNLTLTNEDCRFVYYCLVFFKIIEDNSKNKTKFLPENYIRAVLKQKNMDSWADEELFGSKIMSILDLKNLPKKSANRG